MTEEKTLETRKRRGCLGWLWRVSVVLLLFLVGLLVWLNGPGIRWLGPKVVAHYIEKAGMSGSLRLGGTLLGGLDVYDLEISGAEGALERLVVDRLETDYRFSEVIKGKVRGVSGQGIHVDLRQIAKEKEESPPPDFAQLAKTLESVREKILPLSLDLKDVTFSLKKDGEQVVSLGSTDLSHQRGADLIELDLGTLIGPDGREVSPQEVDIVWGDRRLSLEKLDVLPIAGISNLEVLLPENGEVEASVDIRLDEAVLKIMVGAGIKDVRVDLTEGAVDFAKVMEGVGVELPVAGRLTSLAVDVKRIFPEWQTAEGSVELFLESVSYDGWELPEASLGVRIGEGEYGVKIAGQAMGSGFAIAGNGKFERAALETEGFVTDGISGDLRIEKLGEVLRSLDGKHYLGLGDLTEFPGSEIAGTWNVDLDGGMFAGVSADLLVEASEVEASSLRVDATFAGKIVTLRTLATEGRKVSGTFDTETQSYRMKESMDGFRTDSIAPWLKGAGVELPGSGVVSLEWEGWGNLLSNTHEGALKDLSATWNLKQIEGEATRAPISASGEIIYDWPAFVEVNNLAVETEGQKITLDAKLEDNALTLEKFVWSDGEEEIATGDGKLPVPEDFSDFKGFLSNDSRQLDLEIRSKTLLLAKLKPWVKDLDKIGPDATGKVDIEIGGSLAKPELDANIELRGISIPDQPELPATDVTLKLDARDGVAKITGEAVASDYAPATLDLEMPFLPKKWAEDPDSFKEASLNGKLDLPKLDLSRFQSLVPGATELKGITEGKVVVKGTVGDPQVSGDLRLSGGKLEFEGDTIPGLDEIDLDIQTDLTQVTIKGGIKRVEGGYLDIDGSMAIKDGADRKAGDLDVKLSAQGIPAVRNDFLIVRVNANLRVLGGMTDATVSGEIGIVDSMFYKDMELIPVGKPFLEPSPASLPGISAKKEPSSMVPAPFNGWTANVVLKTIDPLLIRGNLGKGEVDVALRIEGKLDDPKLNGTVRLRDAVARLPFSTLGVKSGTLTFSPATGLDPVIELRGTAEPRPYRVQIYAYGRISDPQLTLTSEPPLPENEIMTLLATGTTSAGLEDSQAASSRGLQLLIEELRRGRFLFGKQLRPVLGLLDNVDFSLSEGDPYDTETYNSARIKLSEKWFVSAGIGSAGEQRVLAIYRLRFR